MNLIVSQEVDVSIMVNLASLNDGIIKAVKMSILNLKFVLFEVPNWFN